VSWGDELPEPIPTPAQVAARTPEEVRDRRRALVRDLAIAAPPVGVLVAFLSGWAWSAGSSGDTGRAWAAITWPFLQSIWAFPLAIAAVVYAAVHRELPRRTTAVVFGTIWVLLGAVPSVMAFAALFRL
jgi:hypothetical protein